MNSEDNDEQKNSFCFDSGPSESSFRVIPPPTAIQCDQIGRFFVIWATVKTYGDNFLS